MCTLPKPPAGRALSEGKEAPQAAFPSWGFPAQTKRRTEGIRVPVPLAWGRWDKRVSWKVETGSKEKKAGSRWD